MQYRGYAWGNVGDVREQLNTQNLRLVAKSDRHPLWVRRRPLQLINFSLGVVRKNRIFDRLWHRTEIPD